LYVLQLTGIFGELLLQFGILWNFGRHIEALDVRGEVLPVGGIPFDGDHRELLEVRARLDDHLAIDFGHLAHVIMATEDDVDSIALLGQIYVVGGTHVGEGDDEVTALVPQLASQLVARLHVVDVGHLVGIDCRQGLQPLPLHQANQPDGYLVVQYEVRDLASS